MGARICVLGSANMDLVVYADRAPERGETVTGRRFRTVPGGKGANQAIAAARAGGDVVMLGAVGRDVHGDALLQVLGDAGVRTDRIARVDEPTGTAHIVVDGTGDNRIVVVPGANGAVLTAPPDLPAALEGAAALLLQLELPLEAVVEAAVLAHERGVPVLLTPAPVRPLPAALLSSVDVLVANEYEAAQLAGVTSVPDVVVTLGARGARWTSSSGATAEVPGHDVRVVDSTGAGDTFAGALAVALAEGRPMPEALRWANAAAALSVQREGASPSMPARVEIDALLAG